MELKEKAIKDVNDVIGSGDPKIHLMKFMMYFKHCEENLMKLSHSNHDEFKSVIPIITEVIISDFKKHYNIISKSSDEYKTFVFRRGQMFDKNMRFNVYLTVSDFDLIMNSLDTEYRKYIGNVQFDNPSINRPQAQKKEGCYIATMVYGDYNHPNVIELRKYRDGSLDKTYFGKLFIRIYYKTSPILVRKIENRNSINNFIRKVLDRIVYKLKSR